jgi:HNH endonuclease
MRQLEVPAMQYPPAQRCVYCFKTREQTTKELTDEHIIPFALQGHLLLPRAVCEGCQPIINEQIEQPLLNEMFWNIRFRGRLQKRSPSKRPQTLRFEFLDKNGAPTVDVPTKEFPEYLAVPYFSPPAVLQFGWDSKETDSGIKVSISPKDIHKHRAVLEGREIEFQNVDRKAFCRLLAKIAHSYAYAEIGYNRFATYRPVLPRLILADDPKWWLVVGGNGPQAPAQNDALHTIGRSTVRRENVEYFVVDLRLFAFMGTPQYQIVVGERRLG